MPLWRVCGDATVIGYISTPRSVSTKRDCQHNERLSARRETNVPSDKRLVVKRLAQLFYQGPTVPDHTCCDPHNVERELPVPITQRGIVGEQRLPCFFQPGASVCAGKGARERCRWVSAAPLVSRGFTTPHIKYRVSVMV